MPDFFIGLMSGTSLDGVDGVLADFSPTVPLVVAHASAPFPAELRAELLALNTPGHGELHRAALAGNALMRVYALVVQELATPSSCAGRPCWPS
jgi:anhydro-N-acetylmuramic acid kinase